MAYQKPVTLIEHTFLGEELLHPREISSGTKISSHVSKAYDNVDTYSLQNQLLLPVRLEKLLEP